MNLICKLFGHKWSGCTCTRCKSTRDLYHRWFYGNLACSLCGKIHEHNWDGCVCKICGAKRDEGHDWDGCRCKKCHVQRDEGHDWNGCRCKKCYKMLEKPQHSWKQYNFHDTITVYGKQTVECKNCGTSVDFDSAGTYCPICFTKGSWKHEPTDDRMFLRYSFTCEKCGYGTGYERNDSY